MPHQPTLAVFLLTLFISFAVGQITALDLIFAPALQQRWQTSAASPTCTTTGTNSKGEATCVVAITSTTTVHATATDGNGQCDNFVGACVVYGSDGQGATYTTTVVAGTSGSGSAVNGGIASSGSTSSDGEIGKDGGDDDDDDDGDGEIGAAAKGLGLDSWTWGPVVCLVMVNLVFVIWI